MDTTKNIQSMMMQGPIPGNSLTDEPGAFPWEQPPQMNDPEEVFNYYVKKISDEEVSDNVLTMLDLGMPISVITGAMLSRGVMDGIHTVDMKLIMKPQLGVVLKNMAEEAGIKYKETMNDYVDKDAAAKRKRMLKLAAKLKQRLNTENMDQGDIIQQQVAEDIVEEPAKEDKPQGLMAKE